MSGRLLCCATPHLAVVLGGIGLTAWPTNADYVVMPALLLGVALVGLGFYPTGASDIGYML